MKIEKFLDKFAAVIVAIPFKIYDGLKIYWAWQFPTKTKTPDWVTKRQRISRSIFLYVMALFFGVSIAMLMGILVNQFTHEIIIEPLRKLVAVILLIVVAAGAWRSVPTKHVWIARLEKDRNA